MVRQQLFAATSGSGPATPLPEVAAKIPTPADLAGWAGGEVPYPS